MILVSHVTDSHTLLFTCLLDPAVTLNVVGDSDEVTEGESITLNITAVGPFVENFMVNIEADPGECPMSVVQFLTASLPTVLQRTRS